MQRKKIPVLYKDQHILVCEKPAGMPVASDKSRDMDMITALKLVLLEEEDLSEEPWLEAVHRLDRPVGGLMVCARTREAAADLSRQIREGGFEKNYQAILCGEPDEDSGTFCDYLLRDGRTNTSKVVDKSTPGAKYAELDYELIDCIETGREVLSWVMITLHTGRHHQIRVQCAQRGLPIYGDSKYNPLFADRKKAGQKDRKEGKGKPGRRKSAGPDSAFAALGLYSSRLSFAHPVSGQVLTFKTEPKGKAFELMDVEAF